MCKVKITANPKKITPNRLNLKLFISLPHEDFDTCVCSVYRVGGHWLRTPIGLLHGSWFNAQVHFRI